MLSAEPIAGHDGNPPVTERIRDLPGHGKRELLRQHRYDTIGWLKQRKLIDETHEQAARRLQQAAEDATIGRYATTGTGGAPGGAFRLADKKLDAMERHAAARADMRSFFGKLGAEAEYLVTLVVIDGKTLGETAAILKVNQRAVLFALRCTLGVLAKHYALA